MFAKAQIDLFCPHRELDASDNLAFSKIALDQCNRGQNLASARVTCISLVMGPAASLAGRYRSEFQWRSVGRKLMDRNPHNSVWAKHAQAEELFAISFRQLYNIRNEANSFCAC